MKRLLTILFVLLAIPVMAQDTPELDPFENERGGTEEAKINDTLPEVLGVCGPIHKSILDLAPKSLDGKLDTNGIRVQESDAGFDRVIFLAPPVVRAAFSNHPPIGIEFHEFKGTVQAASVMWDGTEDEKSAIRDYLFDQIVQSKGPPEPREDGLNEWRDDLIRTAVSWPDREGWLVMFFSCLPTEDQFFDARDAAVTPNDDSVAAAESAKDQSVPSPWDKPSIGSILAKHGQPSEEPYEIDESIIGLHYGGLAFDGMPYEFWYWFFEGKAVYTASEFLPGSGSSNAVGSFETMREMTINMYGEPDENILDEDGTAQRMIWRNGSQGLALTFIEGGGDPWFLLETYDTTHLDKIDTDLRPSRTLPKRYEPPPLDSGKDRMDPTPEVAEG